MNDIFVNNFNTYTKNFRSIRNKINGNFNLSNNKQDLISLHDILNDVLDLKNFKLLFIRVNNISINGLFNKIICATVTAVCKKCERSKCGDIINTEVIAFYDNNRINYIHYDKKELICETCTGAKLQLKNNVYNTLKMVNKHNSKDLKLCNHNEEFYYTANYEKIIDILDDRYNLRVCFKNKKIIAFDYHHFPRIIAFIYGGIGDIQIINNPAFIFVLKQTDHRYNKLHDFNYNMAVVNKLISKGLANYRFIF